jgi:hypothetical protein
LLQLLGWNCPAEREPVGLLLAFHAPSVRDRGIRSEPFKGRRRIRR